MTDGEYGSEGENIGGSKGIVLEYKYRRITLVNRFLAFWVLGVSYNLLRHSGSF